MIKFNLHEDPDMLHCGTMENRSYYMPYGENDDKDCAYNGETTRKLSLNGTWNFKYYENLDEATNYGAFDFLTVATSDMAEIPVPSNWQNHGYDTHQYLNQHFPFPYDPPYVPQERNPLGHYRRVFTLDNKENNRIFMNFEGVDSCYYLFVNGEFVGFSTVSHCTSEFEVTNFIVDGENTVDVIVFKWGACSYLEDQDKLRTSGIFRDVYCLTRPQNYIEDFFIHQELNETLTKVDVKIDIKTSNGGDVKVDFITPCGDLISSATGSESVEFTLDNPQLWNAENPVQYGFILSNENESIYQKIGFRKIEIKDGIVYFNNEKIKFLGVNRHDSDPVTGSAISREQMKKDLVMMKQHNFNAIRTSHYPNAPYMLQMCSELGLYAMAEADLEMHGVVTQLGYYGNSKLYCQLASQKLYLNAVLDRIQKSMIRDKNNTSVLMWSMGNECGYGICFEEAGRWAKAYDSSRLIHYEGVWHADPEVENDISMFDLHSRMYPKHHEIDDYFADESNKLPYIICEYAHAMGIGPGDAEDYMEQIYQYDGICGAFVWEWCDHAVYGGTTPEGKPIYRYGGDFNEFPHDINFCMDGLVFPDRRPTTGLLDFKNVQRPLRVEKVDSDTYRFFNRLHFTNAKDCIDVTYEVREDGETVLIGSVDIDVAPFGHTDVKLSVNVDKTQDTTIIFHFKALKDTLAYDKGFDLGFEEIWLNESVKELYAVESGEVDTTENTRYITISSKEFKYVYDKYTANFAEMSYANSKLIDKPCDWNIWRAQADNDRHVVKQWTQIGYDRKTVKTYSNEVTKNADGGIQITTVFAISAIYIKRFLDAKAVWTISPDGKVICDVHMDRDENLVYLPRFGVRFFLPNCMNECEYTGYGPYESYVDMHKSSTYGKYSSKVADMYVPYVVPQENSSHYNCSKVEISGGNRSLTVESNNKFSFNASEYTAEELAIKWHDYKLEKDGTTVLCIDAKMSGIGSNSCGPELLPQYQLNDKQLDFKFEITPKYIK